MSVHFSPVPSFEIDPCCVDQAMLNGFSVARSAFDRTAGDNFAMTFIKNHATRHTDNQIAERAPISTIEAAGGGAITTAVTEAFRQAGYLDWIPNQNIFMTKESSGPHQDNPAYKQASAIAYFGGITSMWLGPTKHDLQTNPQKIVLKPGDIVFLRALDHSVNYRCHMNPFEDRDLADDTRIWHRAQMIRGPERALLHFGYYQTDDVTYLVENRTPVLHTPVSLY